jgi:hypothetical protein
MARTKKEALPAGRVEGLMIAACDPPYADVTGTLLDLRGPWTRGLIDAWFDYVDVTQPVGIAAWSGAANVAYALRGRMGGAPERGPTARHDELPARGRAAPAAGRAVTQPSTREVVRYGWEPDRPTPEGTVPGGPTYEEVVFDEHGQRVQTTPVGAPQTKPRRRKRARSPIAT